MRDLVIERIKGIWDHDYHPVELDLSLDELDELSNSELLDVYEEMISFKG
jgi:hypothetical protein